MSDASSKLDALLTTRMVRFSIGGLALLLVSAFILLLLGRTELALMLVLVTQVFVLLVLLKLRSDLVNTRENLMEKIDENTAKTLQETVRAREAILDAVKTSDHES